jgi:hypothetical protein
MTEMPKYLDKTLPPQSEVAEGHITAIAIAANVAYSQDMKQSAPPNACGVQDKDGYIVCGPIVGFERPESQAEQHAESHAEQHAESHGVSHPKSHNMESAPANKQSKPGPETAPAPSKSKPATAPGAAKDAPIG